MKISLCDCGNEKDPLSKACESCKKTIRPRDFKVGKKEKHIVTALPNKCLNCGCEVTAGATTCMKCFRELWK